ncbi:hypothetical protein LRS56_04855 [Pseudomonas poae]|nr:hypothetical protein LRS56_04855 [Pseudomonas poae]
MSETTDLKKPSITDFSNTKALAPETILQLNSRLKESAKLHDVWIDPIFFNGGTISVLVLTTLATLLPKTDYDGWAPICAAIAGLFVASERALGFGARWRYHREMRFSYESIIDMLGFYPYLPEDERPKYLRDIFAALYAVRSRESAIPNAGTNSEPT